MNDKITLTRLAALLADRSGLQRKEAEEFLRVFFSTVADALESGENVKIKGFGTFKISQVEPRMSVDVNTGENYEIPAHSKLVFIPSKELAAMVNAPFEMFETIELDDRVAEEEILPPEEVDAVEPGSDISPETPAEDEPTDSRDAPAEDEPEGSPETPAEDEPEYREEAEGQVEISAPLEAGISSGTPVDAGASDDSEGPDVPEDSEASGFSEESDGSQASDSSEESDDSEESEKSDESEDSEESDDTEATEDPGDSEEKPVRRRVFRNGFIWGLIVGLLVIAAGILALCRINEDFGLSMRKVFGVGVTEMPVQEAGTQSDSIAEPAVEAHTVVEGDTAVASGDIDEAADIDEVETGMADVTADLPPEQVVPTEPSDKKKYDTITKTYVLRTMAKKHYGNPDFWPYIYEENKARLGHPNRIPPGTKVVIPPLSKYGVDPKNPSDIAKARKLDREIYARYK